MRSRRTRISPDCRASRRVFSSLPMLPASKKPRAATDATRVSPISRANEFSSVSVSPNIASSLCSQTAAVTQSFS